MNMRLDDQFRSGFVSAVAGCSEEKCLRSGRLNSDGGVEKYSFEVYYDNASVKRQKYMMILQNPGGKSLLDFEIDEIVKSGDWSRYTEKTQGAFANWLAQSNGRFAESFFGVLKKNGLIDFESYRDYVDGRMFFDDFIVTDAVKCNADTKLVKQCHIERCGDKFLRNEMLCNPQIDLIFSFSSRTWAYIVDRFKPEIISEENGSGGCSVRNVSDVHGYLFRLNNNKKIIPLIHFSKRATSNCLRNSYYEYLDGGLKWYNKTISRG